MNHSPDEPGEALDQPIDAEWAQATLQDACTALQTLIDEIERDPDEAAALMRTQMPAVFAKLNYAWNTRVLGPAAIDTLDHDQLVAWPPDAGL